MCGAQSQLQTRRSKCSMCETTAVTVWTCSNCSDGVRKQGMLFCEECVCVGTLKKGDESTAAEKDNGAKGSGEGAEVTDSQVAENDLRRCYNGVEPFAQRRAQRQDHGQECSGDGCTLLFASTQTNRSWIYTCTACKRHFKNDCHAREVGKAPATRAPPLTHAPVSPVPETDASHEHLLLQLSRITDRPTPSATDNPVDSERTRPQVCCNPTASP